MTQINVAVLVYPGVELLDMTGPMDVFIKANRYSQNRYHVFTVAESETSIDSEQSAVCLTPTYSLSTCPRPAIIIIPGQIMPVGSVDRYGSGSEELITWLKDQAKQPETTLMSVCVGISILAKTGLLSNRKATTHWAALNRMQEEFPDVTWVKNIRFMAEGNLITTGGVTSGVDGALYLVEVVDGPDIAKKVADIMVYNREAPLPAATILP